MEQFGILSLGSRLKRLSDHLYNEVQAVYQANSLVISSTYFPILRLLQQSGEQSVVQISEQLGLSHPAVSKQVTKMVQDGLLIKAAHLHDQRRSNIHLSELALKEMQKVEPILAAIAHELEYYLNGLKGDFLTQLSELESVLLKQHYAERVLLRLAPEKLVIKALETEPEAESFKRLNMAWLERYFIDDIYPQDIEMLNAPHSLIQQGGIIKIATFNGRILAGYLLKPQCQGQVELCKLAVDEAFVRLGIAEQLMQDAIQEAYQLGADVIALESHTSLTPALALYHKLGFTIVESPDGFSVPRANIRMTLTLPNSKEAI